MDSSFKGISQQAERTPQISTFSKSTSPLFFQAVKSIFLYPIIYFEESMIWKYKKTGLANQTN